MLKLKKTVKVDHTENQWQPSQKDLDWRYLSKEDFLKKYPDFKEKWYCPPPPAEKFRW